jgi:protein O-mannosyl-transferase
MKTFHRFYMNFGSLLLFLALLPVSVWGQLRPMGQDGTVRAVVVGVSKYQNERIPNLLFAHADAAAFAAYLKSPAGGALPESQVKLLVNEQATQGQMAAALTWLLEESEDGDLAIIYFSGHGDMENETIMNYGFLLTHDAPVSTYMAGGAFPVNYLQSIVQTLSSRKNTRVILVADACHAGQLAGSAMGGIQATAKALAAPFADEAKLLSCQSHEFSVEGSEWGGGHGVFTYYLLDGLSGLADANGDMIVSLLEIERFLEDQVPVATAPHQQMPQVFSNNKGMVMSKVDPPTLAALKDQRAAGQPELLRGALASRSVPPAGDQDSLTMMLYRRYQASLQRKQLLYPEEDAAYTIYTTIRDRPAMAPYRQEMRRELAAALQDDAQQAINDYLAASPLELRRRWSFDQRYAYFPEYLAKAAEILGDEHFMYAELKAKELYFNGLNLRLKGERESQAALYQQAIGLQQQVLQLDSTAAYAYNELGLLARRQGDFEGSIEYFQKVLAFSPTWVLAEANLCGSYIDLDQIQPAMQSCLRALQQDSTFALAHHNLGVALLEQSQRQEAIAAFQQALKYDPEYFMAYAKLGEAYYFDQVPEQAMEAWKAAHRLAPQHRLTLNNLGVVAAELGQNEEALGYFQLLAALAPDEVDTWLEIAELQMAAGRYGEAENALQTCAQLDPALPVTDYLRARLYSLQNQPTDALDALQAALEKGFSEYRRIQSDQSINPLRRTKRFKGLMKQYFPGEEQ